MTAKSHTPEPRTPVTHSESARRVFPGSLPSRMEMKKKTTHRKIGPPWESPKSVRARENWKSSLRPGGCVCLVAFCAKFVPISLAIQTRIQQIGRIFLCELKRAKAVKSKRENLPMVPPVLLQTRNKKPATISYFRAQAPKKARKKNRPQWRIGWALGAGVFLYSAEGFYPAMTINGSGEPRECFHCRKERDKTDSLYGGMFFCVTVLCARLFCR